MAIGGIFEYLGSNSLTFIRDEDRTKAQTDDNRLYGDYEYFNEYLIPYAQPYEQTDSLRIQLRTNYLSFTVTLVSEDGTETSLTPVIVSSDATDFTYYDVVVNLSSLSGCYYIKSQANSDADKVIANFTSNYFKVKEEFKYSQLIEWYGNTSANDGYIWDDNTQELRVEANFIDVLSAGELVTMIDSDNNISVLNHNKAKRKKLQLNLVPDYLALLLDRVIGSEIFIVNGQVWDRDSTFELGDRHGNSRMYSPSVELQLRDYDNDNVTAELEGEFPIIPDVSLAFDGTDSLAFDSTTSLAFT